ncbi:hypothetical protein VSS76_04310 [Bacillus safensis]|uniref:hypothetical protein n=1 Tax=Bacillus safensis TaxID=561879 RepID=UPI002DD44321|nr:hypothetical protein [Bacillus safensis]MEC4586493.1 hypothetical protein [Bacillus safensis]MEC4626315.1 hypothetical protein [Bacillus safensis]
MKKFRVVFIFDKENTKHLLMEGESIEELSKTITNSDGWLPHINDKGVGTYIQLKNVNSFNVSEHKEFY